MSLHWHGVVPWLVLVCVLFFVRGAWAADPRAETAAKQAMAAAVMDHGAGDDDGAILRLQKARKGCGSGRCSALVRASVLRDLGALQFLRGERAKASATFSDALDAAANVPWNIVFNDHEVTAEWAAVRNERAALRETPPEGDFAHVPESEGVVDTPLPMYAELSTPGIATVVVKYKVPGEDEFKRRVLPRFGGGFGGTIPCQDVKRGLLRYFLQAFDADGVPLANSGDVKHLYFVPIRWALLGEPPHLPGQAPPEACNGQPQPEEEPLALAPSLVGVTAEGARYVRLWVGLAGSIDLSFVPSGNNVCALTAALTPANSNFYCTNPNGSDFPTRSTLAGTGNNAPPVPGKSGQSSGGLTPGDVRLLVTLDYALSTHFLTGARVGYVSQSYPGAAASHDGHGISVPLHAELRETYLFGREPLARSGFAPYGYVAAGYGKFDASNLTSVEVQGVEGVRPILVWKMGGPFFAALGGGGRYAFSPRVAFLAGLKATLPFGSAGTLPSVAPEIELHYGF
jgi:hypothetical protein